MFENWSVWEFVLLSLAQVPAVYLVMSFMQKRQDALSYREELRFARVTGGQMPMPSGGSGGSGGIEGMLERIAPVIIEKMLEKQIQQKPGGTPPGTP